MKSIEVLPSSNRRDKAGDGQEKNRKKRKKKKNNKTKGGNLPLRHKVVWRNQDTIPYSKRTHSPANQKS
jgi:hypothetical protein